jgi:hypothetical protein
MISAGSEGIGHLHRESLPLDSDSILKVAGPSCYPKMAKVEFEVSVQKGLIPLVGREEELSVLQ